MMVKVCMLSWEYPPQKVGGLAQHVFDLTRYLSRHGIEVHLITGGGAGAPEYEKNEGVHVYRTQPYQISAVDFSSSVIQFNIALLEKVFSVFSGKNGFAVVHAHDWLVAYAAKALKHAWRVPMIATIHATEYGRNNGLHNDLQRHISDVEWWLTYEAWRVICCSRHMEREVSSVFQLPRDKISVIPNGVDPRRFQSDAQVVSRDHYAAADEKIVFCVGRLVREKGVQVLLDAALEILAIHPHTKFVIAGRGPFEANLRHHAMQYNIANRVYFTGYVDENQLKCLYHWADVAVFPSLYEPFGIVALEAMAARVPVVVSDTGGLGEIVRHGMDGLKCYTQDAHSLAQMVLEILNHPQRGELMAREAYRRVLSEFSWDKIAQKTVNVYRQVWQESRKAGWGENKPGRQAGNNIFSGQNRASLPIGMIRR